MVTPIFFSVKLNSQTQLSKLSIGNEFGPKVVIEGFLGEIKRVSDFEETLVRIEFEKGEISIDMNLQEFVRLLKKEEYTDPVGGE